ncbi:MAG: penicillin acylase family protein [Halodesulfurarchaeum sp.]
MTDIDRVRRGVAAAALAGVAGGGFLSPVRSYLDRFAPLSGSVWEAATSPIPRRVESPHGSAQVRYDDRGVPEVRGETERALYFAVGYLHAQDRLFQMDLQRRVMRGELSAVAGPATLESDRFHVAMDFLGAAEATWSNLQGTETGDVIQAYADGVNRFIADRTLPVEFALLGYEPDRWHPVDTMLMEKQISWDLTGSFRTLRLATLREVFGSAVVSDLFPTRFDHEYPILGPHRGGEMSGGKASLKEADGDGGDFRSLLDWVGDFEGRRGLGSNSWVVSGEYTESGDPIVANDPHLSLMAPPVWYQQHLEAPGYRVRGVTFPGVPFVIIGENRAGAWGFTNVGADVVDFYEYTIEGDRYRYRSDWRPFDTETETIEVAGERDRTVEVRKTVHGPVLEREGMQVACAWTGLTATETTLAVHRMARSEGLDDFLAATRRFDLPTQNVVYADRAGNTLYYVTGRIPIRTVDGEEVSGNQIFDGSRGEGEWEGFTPYGTSEWSGFVPFEEKPGVINPGYVATANQRVVDDPAHYIGTAFAPPFRGKRLYDRLDRQAGSITPASTRDLQLDTFDERAAMLVPELLEMRDALDSPSRELVDALRDWDFRMEPSSRGALVFAVLVDELRRSLFEGGFAAANLDDSYWPGDWVVLTLEDDSPWFDLPSTPDSRNDAIRTALDRTHTILEREGWTDYGQWNTVSIDHPFDQPFLNYPRMPTGGSRATVNNYRKGSDVGSSWRMVVPMSGGGTVVLPGGNIGHPFGAHYSDQLSAWAQGRYLRFDRAFGDAPDIEFGGEET